MLSARVRTIIISNPRERKRERATAYIIINILVADPLHIFVCASISEHGVRVRAYKPRYNGRPRTGVELEERTEREALFAYGTTLYNVERLFRYLQGVHVENFPAHLFCTPCYCKVQALHKEGRPPKIFCYRLLLNSLT